MLPERCGLCPRRCGANRRAGEKGLCGAGDELKAARAALHHWEEPCLSGEAGSGTVFFSHCSLRCVYCQNREISRGEAGRAITWERLSEIFLELQAAGALNVNLVTPTHYLPFIFPALERAKKRGLTVPVVYNTSGYELPEVIRALDGLVDIYLPDFKYVSPELSLRYSGAADYFKYASAALSEMVRQAGKPVFRGDILQRGVIVRHLCLPGCLWDSRAVLRHLWETHGSRIYISIMSQFTPMNLSAYPELNRRVAPEEYEALVDYAVDLGIEQGFIQEGEAASESFVPPFDLTGV
ncbi:radical SAM protein [Gehongia tenuis]|uniref:Radical SAM protein n=1 Tax=Gehongia tenuis TaxID=2763655 RepID=A0A926HPQ4_9FIRM|nr:radical SAM protein [Gehongia tenuis]MBC8530436.1 radical SAM protein [Gehongia tenuis]